MKKKKAIALLFAINIIYIVFLYRKDFVSIDFKFRFGIIVLLFIYIALKYKKNILKTDAKPSFDVVVLSKPIKEYIEKCRNNKDDIDKLYKKIVYKPIWKKIVVNSEYFF